MRPKSLFLGGYALFSTSELLYYDRQRTGLFIGKECSLIHPRTQFRKDWRAMLTASYLSALFIRTTPEHAPQRRLFDLYEELLDLAVEYGSCPPFIFWAELRFFEWHGHAPNFENCSICNSKQTPRFSAALGSTLCATCANDQKISTIEISPDVLAILRRLQKSKTAYITKTMRLTRRQIAVIHCLLGNFSAHQLDIPPAIRHKIQYSYNL